MTPQEAEQETARRQLQRRRLQQALSIVSEHFSGVLLLAHENTGSGNVNRYVGHCGDILAVQRHADLWVQAQGELVMHADVTQAIQESDAAKGDEEDDE